MGWTVGSNIPVSSTNPLLSKCSSVIFSMNIVSIGATNHVYTYVTSTVCVIL